MKMRNILTLSFIIINICIVNNTIIAQNTTQQNGVINIFSTYEPTLFQIYPKQVFPISSEPILKDKVELNYTYFVPEITISKPTLPDSLEQKEYSSNDQRKIFDNILKLGYGNNRSPYGLLSLNLGNQKNLMYNFFSTYNSSQGALQNQSFSNLRLASSLQYLLPKDKVEFFVSYDNKIRNLYGYDNSIESYAKNEVERSINLFSVGFNLFNTKEKYKMISYSPKIRLDYLDIFLPENIGQNPSENIFSLYTPITFDFNKVISLSIVNDLYIGSYNSVDENSRQYLVNYSNVETYISIVNTKYFSLQTDFSIGYVLDGNESRLLYSGNISTKFYDKKIKIALSGSSYFQRNSMNSLIDYNPFFDLTYNLQQTFIDDYLLHLSYNDNKQAFKISGGIRIFEHLPLFNQEAIGSKNYILLFSNKLSSLYVNGDYSYTKNNRTNFTLGFKGYIFSDGVENYSSVRNWGYPPLEVYYLHKQRFGKKLWLNSSFKLLAGIQSEFPNGGDIILINQAPTILDWSLGLEYKISPIISIWGNGYNLLNQTNTRWIGYPTIGITGTLGVIFHLDIKSFIKQ